MDGQGDLIPLFYLYIVNLFNDVGIVCSND